MHDWTIKIIKLNEIVRFSLGWNARDTVPVQWFRFEWASRGKGGMSEPGEKQTNEFSKRLQVVSNDNDKDDDDDANADADEEQKKRMKNSAKNNERNERIRRRAKKKTKWNLTEKFIFSFTWKFRSLEFKWFPFHYCWPIFRSLFQTRRFWWICRRHYC